ncbi:MAG: TonB-dependent receptor [Gemmatimonadales bacterium]|jgi:hypothetical protein|nr:MAG: TonB-dependent receptor [Gemmatimonadales bacterium]
MSFSRSLRGTLSAVATLFLLPGLLAAQSISGRITARADGAPVAGAQIILLDESGVEVLGTAESGPEGEYALAVPRAGVFLLMVERAGFANQVSTPIAVGEGEAVSFSLSMTVQRVGQTGAVSDTLDDATLLAMAMAEICEGVFVPGMHGILYGAVRNEADGEPLAFIQAEAEWTVSGIGEDRREVRSDDAGAYIICNAPAATPLRVRAFEPETDVQGEEERLTLRAGTMRKLDLGIPLSNPSQPGNLLGRVTDDQGTPLVGAEVRLVGAGRVTATNDRGVFVLEEVPAGPEVIEAEALGYAMQREAVRVLGGRAQEIIVRLATEPVQLAPILVSVRPRKWFSDRRGLEQRIALGAGYIMLREDIEERAPQVLGEALRGIPGVSVTRLGGGIAGTYSIQLRGAANLANQACNPMVWVDGVNWGNDGSIFRDIQAFEIEAIEVYRGAAEVPGEFSGQEARCGVVVVWTRRGRVIGN